MQREDEGGEGRKVELRCLKDKVIYVTAFVGGLCLFGVALGRNGDTLQLLK